MNGRYLNVERFAAVLVTASLLLAGCEPGEARVERDSEASSESPAPASEQAAPLPDTSIAAANDPASPTPAATTPASSDAGTPGSAASTGAAAEDARDGRSAPTTPRESSAGQASGQTGDTERADRPATSSQSSAASQEEILRATSRAYEGLRSFRAGFEQTLRNTLLGRTTRSEGTLYQRQPDRFLMAFSDPDGDRIVSDGEYFWMYFPSVDPKQVIRTARGAGGLDLHAQFIGDPVRRFETTYHGTEAVRGRTAHVMTLVPREPLGYKRLKVWIDEDDHLVRQFELTESNDNVRHFVLRDMVKNPTLADTLFHFTPPPGAQVVTR